MATGRQKGARTRAWAKEFDRVEFLRAMGLEPHRNDDGTGSGATRLPGGRWVTIFAGTSAGKVQVTLSDPFRSRVFNANEAQKAREWVDGGGKLPAEETLKAQRSAGPELYAALKSALAHHVRKGAYDCEECEDLIRAALAKAEQLP